MSIIRKMLLEELLRTTEESLILLEKAATGQVDLAGLLRQANAMNSRVAALKEVQLAEDIALNH